MLVDWPQLLRGLRGDQANCVGGQPPTETWTCDGTLPEPLVAWSRLHRASLAPLEKTRGGTVRQQHTKERRAVLALKQCLFLLYNTAFGRRTVPWAGKNAKQRAETVHQCRNSACSQPVIAGSVSGGGGVVHNTM